MERLVILKYPISVWPAMAETFECGIGNGEVGMRNAENRGRHWEVRLKIQC